MATVSNIKSINSVSSENLSMVILEFEESANMDSVNLEMREKLDQTAAGWEDKIGNPMIININPDMLPVMVAAVSREGYSGPRYKQIAEEEMRFNKTIDQGLGILGEMMEDMKAAGSNVLSGENAFKLYDTYGFPLDLTREILEEKGDTVDEEGFAACMEEQRRRARNARKGTNYMGGTSASRTNSPM